MIKILRYFTIFLLISYSFTAFSQTQGVLGRRFFSNWSIGVGGGPNVFFGDLKVTNFWPVSTNMNEWRYAGTFSLTKQVSHVFAFRAQVMYGELSGTKRYYKDGSPCNQYFDGNVLEYNINTTINISNLFSSYKPGRKFFVYGTLGVGLSTYDAKTKDLNAHLPLDSIRAPRAMAAVGIAGIGAYYSFGDKVNLGIEWNLHGVNADNVDVTKGGFQYDAYSMASINLTYNFNRKNPGKLQPANVGKQLGPMPVKPEPVATKPTAEKTAGMNPNQGKLPELPTPLGFPVRDTVKQKMPQLPVVDTLVFSDETPDTGTLLPEETAPIVPGITYRVQIFAFETNEYSAESVRAEFKLSQPVYKEFTEGWYRYTVGSFKTFKSAKSYMNKLRSHGIKGAFIARYNDGIRIPTHP